MTDTPLPEAPPRPFSLRRRLAWLGGLFALALAAAGVGFSLSERSAGRGPHPFEAELDASDPGWRLEDLEAARITPPAGRNSATLCKEVNRLLGPRWPDEAFEGEFRKVVPGEPLDPARRAMLEAELKRLEPARRAAQGLADMPTGRFEIDYRYNPIATLLPHVDALRRVALLLRYEGLDRANGGDVTGAVRAGRAGVCAARALYDEPFPVSQIVRINTLTTALLGVEYALSMGEATDGELAALDRLLADEERHPTLLIARRGDRAVLYAVLSRLGTGQLPMARVRQDLNMRQSWWGQVSSDYWPGQFGRPLPAVMKTTTAAVESARLPPWEQGAREKDLEREMKEIALPSPLDQLLQSGIENVGAACRRKTALVSSMRGLIAVERYRMKHGRMPARLADVAPAFLDRVPLDPFDGKPLRMARVADGVVVYSVGPDGNDDGGKLDRESLFTRGTDLGFQLWDEARRRGKAAGPGKRP